MTAELFVLWGIPPTGALAETQTRIKITRGNINACSTERKYRERLGWTALTVQRPGVLP